MTGLPTDTDISADHSKSNIWTLMKHRNASSPSLHTIGNKNWSTRSLPRFGSFDPSSSATGSSTSPSQNSSPSCTPVEETFSLSIHESSPKKLRFAKDCFSSLPNEVKLQIFSYLSVKTIRRISSVLPTSFCADCRFVNYGACCAMMAHCTEQLILEHFIGTSRLRCYSPCWFLPAHFFDI